MKKWIIRQYKLFICFIWGHDPETHHKQKAKYNIETTCKRCNKKLKARF